jgi:hypothetical protein
MSPGHGLAIDGHNVGDAYGPVEVFRAVGVGANVGIRRKLGNVGGVFIIQNIVCYVDLQNRRRRDLRQAQSRARGRAESRSKSGFPMQP